MLVFGGMSESAGSLDETVFGACGIGQGTALFRVSTPLTAS